MIDKVRTYIQQQELAPEGQPLLLAVSGGADSICMADILLRLGYRCTVLHCNFNLRGKESDADEDFVRQFFLGKCELKTISFATIEYANKNGISIEMAARDLRYEWFEAMSEMYDNAPVCTAHNKNDNAETLLLNLCRGTGLQGLTGIKNIRGIYQRPLLDCTRAEIEAYCAVENIPFCTDSTNMESIYRRNKIRLEIIPLLSEINPSFVDSISETILKLQATNTVYVREIERLKSTFIKRNTSSDTIELALLRMQIESPYVLFDILREYQCSMNQTESIFRKTKNENEMQFHTKTHILYKKSELLQIYKLATITREQAIFQIIDAKQETEYFRCKTFEHSHDFIFETDKLYFDCDLLSFPLTFRKWNPGDKMCPWGMNGRSKKVSDILNEHKVSAHDKITKRVLTNGEDIIWVAGNRISHKYAVSSQTKNIMCLEILKNI